MNAAQHARADLVAYLAQVAADLFGPRQHRERILAELRDGLDQAVADHSACGLTTDHAVAAAIGEFGSPQTVADAFAPELAVAYARRSIAWFILTGPLVGVWWLLLLYPTPWRSGVVALFAAIPVFPLIIAAIATAAGTFATTGRLIRWLPEASPRRALFATITLASLALAADVVLIVLYGWSVISTLPLGVAAITPSLVRIACGTRTIHRAAVLQRRIADVHR